ncbi:MAG: hypothetical protein AB7U38_14030 [Hyphomicrobiales bacterium]
MSGNRGDIRVDASGFAMLARTDQIGQQMGLKEAARIWTCMWHLMEAMGARPGPRPSYPYSLPLHVTCRPGTRYCDGDLILSPSFGDLIMGWPPGWSDTAVPVTEWSRWLRRSRGELSRLLSEFDAEPAEAAA